MMPYVILLLFITAAFLLVTGGLLVGKLLRPNLPNPVKLSTYESGEEAIGTVWGSFNVRFYVIGLVFLLFEVELLFFFPWAVVFTDPILVEQTQGVWKWFLWIEMLLFGILLAIGLFFIWKKGFLDWQKPISSAENIASKVPDDLYEQLNKRYE